MPKSTAVKSSSRAAPYPAPRSPLQARDTNLCPHHAAQKVSNQDDASGIEPVNRQDSTEPSKPSGSPKIRASKLPTPDPNESQPPPRLPSPTIPESAKSFLDVELPTLPNSCLPPVYDTCMQVRQKITKLINNKTPSPEDGMPGKFNKDGSPKPWTVKVFCEAIGGVNTWSHAKFMKKTGPMGGAENGVYSGAYVFFEKKRIWEKKPKSGARKKVEEENPYGLAVEDHTSHARVTKAIGNRGTGRKQWTFATMPDGSIGRKLR